MNVDLLLRGGTVIDGTGSAAFLADVAVAHGHIRAIGDLATMQANQELDVTGRVVCPGFIDIHTHSDVSLLLNPAGESKILQGVTTEVTGNCSLSAFPLAADRLGLHADHLEWMAYGASPPPLAWLDLDGYASRLAENPPALNVAPLVGHGTVRIAVMGVDHRQPSEDELLEMKRLVAECIDQGAFGLSTGLTILPSAYADVEEVRELVRVVASREALYATHARSPVGAGFPEVEEAISTSHEASARLQFSHVAINEPSKWGRAYELVSLFEKAERKGLDVRFDVYPYAASSSALSQYMPDWVQAGGLDVMRRRLSDDAVRERAQRDLSAGWAGGIPWLWDRVVISRIGQDDHWCVGLSIEEASERAGLEPAAFALDMFVEYGNGVGVVLYYRTEEDLKTFLAHRLAIVGSDGLALPLAQAGQPHPRSFGTYPRVLGRYVRDEQVLSLPDAVHKMTGAVAERLQLVDRGMLRVGSAADMVVFDPITVIDGATFSEPNRQSAGITHVLVNGLLVVVDGEQTSARPGRLLRRTR